MVLEQLNKCMKKVITEPLTPHTKINLGWIIALNAKAKTIRLLQENTGENLHL